jgi:hypothetical protein
MKHRRRESDAGKLADSEMAHNGGICQQEQRFSNERTEGRNGEPKYLPGVAR